ncbi:MAG: hypothetical protein Q7J72_04610 [Candidatus Omnitrophota bacterium]|nr:hypothetical protein [Candidatus Omnitrophota bacterium]
MKYAKVVLGLPVDELFDYSIPENLSGGCSVGCRVGVSFGRRNLIGYVVGVSLKTKIKKIKPISRLIDVNPILDSNFLQLTKAVSDYYCSSWGQAIEAALPVGVRKGLAVGGVVGGGAVKTVPRVIGQLSGETRDSSPDPTPPRLPLVRGGFLTSPARGEGIVGEAYSERIDVVLAQNKSVLILAPEIRQCVELFNLIKAKYPDKIIELTYRKLKVKEELAVWEKAVNGCIDILIGTRAAVFSPLPNLGLIIIDREDSYGYKEEQAPYYQAPEVGRMRARLEGIPLILSSRVPSLDMYYGLREKKYSSIMIGQLSGKTRDFSPHLTPPHLPLVRGGFLASPTRGEEIAEKYSPIGPTREDLSRARITLVDLKQYGKKKSGMLFSPVLEDKLNKAISAGKKALIFINRKGYARFAHCQKCGFALSCDKCSSRLVFHFEEKKLVCSSCGFKKDLLKICPSCNAQYIKYSGFGIEKAVSQLNLYFPQAKIVRLDKEHQDIPPDFQIIVATEKIFHSVVQPRFDLSAVIDLDSVLNMVDFRNNEKLYRLLDELRSLTKEELIIQTRIPEQYQNKEFLNLELNKLFDRELKERKELELPPYTHLTHINLRGKNLERTKSAALGLYEKLKGLSEEFEIFEPVESIPSKLRGNFRFHILLKAKNQLKLSKFLKKQLKKTRYSGVILTVEVDPE